MDMSKVKTVEFYGQISGLSGPSTFVAYLGRDSTAKVDDHFGGIGRRRTISRCCWMTDKQVEG